MLASHNDLKQAPSLLAPCSVEMDDGGGACPDHRLTKRGFFSKEAVAFRSLVYVKMRQDFVNMAWVRGLQWLSERSEEEVLEWYLDSQ